MNESESEEESLGEMRINKTREIVRGEKVASLNLI